MSFITFQCYGCNQMLKVSADKAGRKAKCNKCGTLLTIPVASAGPGAGPAAEAAPQRRPASAAVRRPSPPAAAPAGPTPVAPIDEGPPPRAGRDYADGEDVRPRRRGRRQDEFEEEDLEEARPRRGRRDEEDDEEEDRPLRRPVSLWPRVRVGLLIVFIAACVLGGGAVFEAIATLLTTIITVQLQSGHFPSLGMLSTIGTMTKISVLIMIAASITAIVGYVFSLLGPSKRGTLGLAIATLAVAGVGLLLNLVIKVPALFGRDASGGPAGLRVGDFAGWLFVLFLPGLLLGAEIILFSLFLRAVSLLRRDGDNARGCMIVLVLACVFTGLRALRDILTYALLRAASSSPPARGVSWLSLTLGWLILGAYIATLVVYILRLWRTRALAR
jgi:hypothetical protein